MTFPQKSPHFSNFPPSLAIFSQPAPNNPQSPSITFGSSSLLRHFLAPSIQPGSSKSFYRPRSSHCARSMHFYHRASTRSARSANAQYPRNGGRCLCSPAPVPGLRAGLRRRQDAPGPAQDHHPGAGRAEGTGAPAAQDAREGTQGPARWEVQGGARVQ